ncbi:MAG: hypothetical protein ABIJ09_13035 [Pseudomonadota bacterium]
MSFRAILQRVVEAHPGVLGVLFCDEEGELVDMALAEGADLDPYELRVLAASGASWLRTVTRVAELPSERVQQWLRHERVQVLIEGLPEHYYLVAVVTPTVSASVVAHSLRRAGVETRAEM